MIRKQGVWGKFCVQNFDQVISKSKISWQFEDLGRAVCKTMTYE